MLLHDSEIRGAISKQSFGSQAWDASLAIQALQATDLTQEIGPILKKGLDFIKASQVKDNPSGNFKSMHRHISKGSWTFSDQDHGWQVSDCKAEGLKCCLLFSMIPPEIVGKKIEPEQLYNAVNIILSLTSKTGGLSGWEPAGSSKWLEILNPTVFFIDVVIEHKYVECTSSAIQAMVLFKKLYPEHRREEVESLLANAGGYLEKVQMPDGSWFVSPLSIIIKRDFSSYFANIKSHGN